MQNPKLKNQWLLPLSWTSCCRDQQHRLCWWVRLRLAATEHWSPRQMFYCWMCHYYSKFNTALLWSINNTQANREADKMSLLGWVTEVQIAPDSPSCTVACHIIVCNWETKFVCSWCLDLAMVCSSDRCFMFSAPLTCHTEEGAQGWRVNRVQDFNTGHSGSLYHVLKITLIK